jgi:NAD(P) transhydrogenase
MARTHYDVIVIGTGPGGEGAAMKCAKSGRAVAVIDGMPQIGGSCTHKGTIPSKALRYSIFRLTEIQSSPLFRQMCLDLDVSFGQLRNAAQSVVDQQVGVRRTFYDRNRIPIVCGHARFIDAQTVQVEQQKGASERLTADAFVIATGSRPYRPADVDFEHPRVFDSDKILSLEETPQSITIYGAGVVGSEYASMFRNLGCKVNLINTRSRLLEFLDDEITDALSYHLREKGVLIRHNEEYDSIVPRDDGVILKLKSNKQIKTDILLWANGRTGNSDGLNLDQLGITADSRGNIPVNKDYQSSVPHIYAVGDVIGPPALASVAYDQGRFAATHLVTGNCSEHLVEFIPTGIYTSPEISSVGRTERELTAAKVPYEVGHASFKSLARGQITGNNVGMLKLLFHRKSLQLLGIHCFGANASEIVHIGQAIMAQPGKNNTLKYFINTTFNYPTMAEAYRVAALNGMNRLF